MNYFKSDSINELYYYLLEKVNNSPDNTIGNNVKVNINNNGYKECLNINLELTNPCDNKITIKNNPVDYKYADSFLEFIMSGNKFLSEKFLKKYPHCKGFLDSGELPENFSAAYGPKIKRQLPKVIKLLKENPKTRWGIIHILLEEDKKIWDYKTTMEYPCCMSFQFNINDRNELNMITNMRSQNIVAVFPYDIYLYTKIQAFVAKELKIKVGKYYHNMASAHYFDYNQKELDETLNKFQSKGRGIILNKELDQIIDWVFQTSRGKYNKSEIDPKLFILGESMGMGFNIGNATKYLSRYISKVGEKLYDPKDLIKAVHYILLELKRRSIEK